MNAIATDPLTNMRFEPSFETWKLSCSPFCFRVIAQIRLHFVVSKTNQTASGYRKIFAAIYTDKSKICNDPWRNNAASAGVKGDPHFAPDSLPHEGQFAPK
jgi:hypothetical protein